MTEAKVLYFGCVGGPGHYMHRPNGGHPVHDWHAKTPWGSSPDGILCSKDPRETQGLALLHHKDGWTALSFWDRSVDRRGGCNSNFFAEGNHSFEDMLKLAREAYPQVMGRLPFEVVPAAAPEEV